MKQRVIGWAVALTVGLAVAPAKADDVLRATLPNGLRVVVVPNRLAPVVTTELNYLVGSADAPEGFPGTAHALEHMMFRGAAGLDRDQLSEISARLGGIYNASTTETVTQYTYTAPATDLATVLKIESLRMRGLTLNQADWEQERGAIEQEVSRDLSSPFYNFMAQAQSILFSHSPYEYDALGSRESFDKTDAARLRAFYDAWYAPNNAILVIAGDVDPNQALDQVRDAFKDIPSHQLPAHAATVLAPIQPQTLSLPTNFSAGFVALAYRMPGLKQADFATADILSDVLSSERGTLYGLVPAGKALAAQFSYQAKPDVGFGLMTAAFPAGGDPEPLLAEVKHVLADIVEKGVSPELVTASKRQELAQLAFSRNSIQGLANKWSWALAFQDAQSPDDIAGAYQAVTVDDVNRLARQILDPDHAITAILTPRQSGQAVAGSGFGAAESFGGAPDHPVTLPAWASQALATLNLPDPGEKPDVSVLPNGVQLIVQPEHVSHTVLVYGHVRQSPSMQEPAGKEGIARLMRGLFDSGTEAHDRLGYREAVDALAAEVNLGPSFSLAVLTSAFEPGMQLLAEGVLHPAFPADAFETVRSQISHSTAGLLQSPDYVYHRAIQKALVPEGDPTLRQATPDSIMAVQLDDLRAFYKATIRPDLTTIVVAGDVTPEQARRVATETFGRWQSSGPTPVVDLPPVKQNNASFVRVPDSSAIQDTVALVSTVELPVNSPDRYTLMLGNAVLGSGFSSKLYQDLRIHSGYVYSVSSNLDWSRARGDYTVSFGADAANVEKAKGLVLRDLKDMQTTPITDAELNRVKAEVLRRLPMQRASIGSIAGQYLRFTDLGLPLDSAQIAAERYQAITAADIQAAFEKWLRPDALAMVVKGPTE